MEKLLEKKTFDTSRKLTYTYYISAKDNADYSKPTVLLCHGFPDDAHLWEKIVPHLQSLSFPILAPDLLGYGGTSKPLDPAVYNSRDVSQDLAELLDHEDIKSVISTGHDWGSYVAQRFSLWHPERCAGLILLNVAYAPPNPEQPFDLDAQNQMLEKMTGHPRFTYWHLFTAPDGAKLIVDKIEAFWHVLHGDEPDWMEKMFCVPGKMREFLEGDQRVPLKPYAKDKALHDRFVERMKRDGFDAPVLYYTAMKDNHQYNAEKELSPERFKVTVPVLFIGCDGDAVCLTAAIYGPQQAGLLPDLTIKELHSAHWCPLEVPDEVGNTMVDWLKSKEHALQAKN